MSTDTERAMDPLGRILDTLIVAAIYLAGGFSVIAWQMGMAGEKFGIGMALISMLSLILLDILWGSI